MSNDSTTVLYVDDDSDLTETVATFIERTTDKVSIETATSAAEARRKLDETAVDCVVSDYDLPGGDGIELLESVRAEFPQLPFILYTGTEGVASDAIAAGATDYVRKEPSAEQYTVLVNRIENVVDLYRAERDVSRLRRKLRDQIENPPDCGWVYDCERDDLRFVSGYEDVWKRPVDALESDLRNFSDGIHPADREDVTQAMDRLSSGRPIEIECRSVRGDGSTGQIRIIGEPIVDHAGTVVHLVGRVRDLTGRKRSETPVERQKNWTAPQFADLDEPIVEVHIEDGTATISSMNEAFMETFAVDDGRVGDSFDELIAPQTDRERAVDRNERLERGTVVEQTLERETVDGTRVFQLVAIPVTDNGAVVLFRPGQDRLSDRADFQEIMANLRNLFVWVGSKDNFQYVSPGFEDIWGRPPPEAINDFSVFENGFHPADRAKILGLDDNPLLETDDGTRVFEHRVVQPDGSVRWVEARAFPISNPKMPSAEDAGMTIDITERKRAQLELERQKERLEEFSDVVSHDLRNPLNVAAGHLQLARAECESEHLDATAEAHDRMEALIDDLLSLARQGDSVSETEQVDLAAVVAESWRHVTTESAVLRSETTQVIRADRGRLKQLLENLFRNAVEHAGPDVRITVGDHETGFFVADNGPGIPDSHRSDVLDSGYTTSEDGTGFGLAIVDQIADAHGWELQIADSDDEGARFEFNGVDSVS